MITLDDKTHIYKLKDGRTPPSVSKILDLYFPPSRFFTENGAMLGTARHLWANAIARGIEMENEPDPRIAGAVAGFRKFMAEVNPKYISGEVPYYDSVLNVCGKPDLVAEIAGKLSIVDYKPETKNKRTPVQTAAYALMLRHNNIQILDRYELRLLDGDYRLDRHRSTDDEKRWPVLVAAFHAANYYR